MLETHYKAFLWRLLRKELRVTIIRASTWENLSSGVWEQHGSRPDCTYLRSLISAFVICFLGSIICKLATDEISIFKLVSVAEKTGLSFTLSKTLDRFFRAAAHMLKWAFSTVQIKQIVDAIWASPWDPLSLRFARPACASMQSFQRLSYLLFGKYHI